MRMARRHRESRATTPHKRALMGIASAVLVIALMVLLTVLVGHTIPATSAASLQSGISSPSPTARSLPSNQGSTLLGSPAIPLRAVPTQFGAYFTAADATTYVATHRIPRATESGPHTVISVEFLTNGQLNARISSGGNGLDLPSTALLCYVVVHGTFTFAGPMGASGTYHSVYLIFNAQNGYFLSLGGIS